MKGNKIEMLAYEKPCMEVLVLAENVITLVSGNVGGGTVEPINSSDEIESI